MGTDSERARKNDRQSLFWKIGNRFSDFGKRFADGSLGTKISHFIFGAGNIYNGQIIKGLLFLLIQAGILAVMIFCPTINDTPYGWKALVNLSLKNTTEGGDFDPLTGELAVGSDCKLMVLFGFVTIALIVIYFLVWNLNKISVGVLALLVSWMTWKFIQFMKNPEKFVLVNKVELYTYLQESTMLLTIVCFIIFGKI